MTFSAGGEMYELHDRARLEAGSGEVVSNLQEHFFAPASQLLGAFASNRATLAIFDVAKREANWDGYGSQRANDEAIARAATIADVLIQQANGAGLGWLDPHVGLNETGNVSFEWWNGERKLTLYITPEATEFVSSWGPNIETQMEAGLLEGNDFLRHWRWLRTRES